MKHALTRIVSWGHALLAEVIDQGDLVVDLTAGNGHDTLMLFRLVGGEGQVVAFDIQDQALQATEDRLKSNGARVRRAETGAVLARRAGVDLVSSCHAELDEYLPEPPKAVIANLGYLPGGDLSVITRPGTTLTALSKACVMLAPGGRLAVVIYPGHEGGKEEAEQVDSFFRGLSEQDFGVLGMRVENRSVAPYLQIVEKNSRNKGLNRTS